MEHSITPKQQFSGLGLAGFAILGIGTLAQILLIAVVTALYPHWMEHPWGMWLITFSPIYLIAIPIGLLILRKLPAKAPTRRSMKGKTYIVVIFISLFMMYAGNLLGTVINTLLQIILGISAGNPVLDYTMDQSILPKIIFLVILAPVFEEYVFRKQLIDRMHCYGEKTAVIVSALMFGLFHGNLAQFFYAFALGLVFGYVYLKTGKLRYSIGLHMLINSLGSVVGPLFLEKASAVDTTEVIDITAITPEILWTAGLGLYALLLIGCSIGGLVLLCTHIRKVTFTEADMELPKEGRFKTVYLNTGMVLFTLLCMAMIVASAILA